MLKPNLRIAAVVSEYKRKWTKLIEEGNLEELCKAQGCRWRERVLTPVRTLQLFLLQILHGNTACSHLRHLSGINFSGMAYCKARTRLPLSVLERLVNRIARHLPTEEFKANRWHGHRVGLGDGRGCSMPDTEELRTYFGQPSGQRKGCGFPVAHLLVLMHAGTGMIQKLVVAPFRTHALSRVVDLHPDFEASDVVVKDRGFCSFAHLGLLVQRNVQAVFRVHQKQKVHFRAGRPHAKPKESGHPTSRWVKKLGGTAHLVQWPKPRKPSLWMSEEQFARLPPNAHCSGTAVSP